MSPKADYGDRLADYIEVKDRIRLFYEAWPDGRLTTAEVTIHTDPDGEQRVMVKALAYRTPDDPVPGAGHSWMVLPGSTPYTRGSEVENTETSAWGRAIGSLGIGIDKSIASAGEVRDKAGEGDREERKPSGNETLELLGRIQKTGRVEKGGSDSYKAEWRETPDGHAIGFRLNIDGEDRAIPQVLITGAYGEALYLGQPAILGERITVKGHLYNVKVPGRKGYYRLVIGEHPDSEFIETSQIRVPAESIDPTGALFRDESEPIPVVEGQESFDLTDEEKAAIAAGVPDAEEAKAAP